MTHDELTRASIFIASAGGLVVAFAALVIKQLMGG